MEQKDLNRLKLVLVEKKKDMVTNVKAVLK